MTRQIFNNINQQSFTITKVNDKEFIMMHIYICCQVATSRGRSNYHASKGGSQVCTGRSPTGSWVKKAQDFHSGELF